MVSRWETKEMVFTGRQKRWCQGGDRGDGVNGETEEMVSMGET